jgi:hypothetical protein
LAFELFKQKIPWKLPLREWAQEPSSPDQVKRFIGRQERFQLIRDLFLGAFNPVIHASASPAIAWRRIEIEGLDRHFLRPLAPSEHFAFPAFPAQIKRYIIKGNQQTESLEDQTQWFPIGFECILEGNAQALQRTLLEGMWPDDVARRVWDLQSRYQQKISALESASLPPPDPWILPYNITDLLITKHLRPLGRPTFQRRLVTEISDWALMNGLAPIPGKQMTIISPAEVFVQTVDRLTGSSEEDARVIPPPLPSSSWQHIYDSYAGIPREEDLLAQSPQPGNCISLLEAYVAHHVICPLLQARMEQGADLFSNPDKYLAASAHLPKPPFIALPSRMGSIGNVPDWLLPAWAEFVVFRDIARQLIDGHQIVSCPRAYGRIPGITTTDLTTDGSGCSKNVEARRCLTWSEGRLADLPKCLFTQLIRLLGLENQN